MPRATRPRINAQYLQWLQELRDEHDDGVSRKHYIYSKAFKSLKEQTTEYATPQDLISVKFIGPDIIRELEKRSALQNGTGGTRSQPVASGSKPRGRPPKRSATDVDMEAPPAAKRRSVSSAQAIPQPPPVLERSNTMPAGEIPGPFQFWYLDGQKRAANRADAEVSWCEDGSQMLRMKIGYPISQQSHPLVAQLFGRERRGDHFVAEMREDTADAFPQCTVREAAPRPAPAQTQSLGALLRAEEKLKRSTIDPSRQLPTYLQKSTNAVASGSGSSKATAIGSKNPLNASDMRLAAAARSYSSLSEVSRPSTPYATASPSTSAGSSPVRPTGVHRAATLAAGTSHSSSNSHLQRTSSAPNPLPRHTRPRLSHNIPNLPPVEHPSLYTPLQTFKDFAPRVFKAGTYTIDLVLDHREYGGKKGDPERDAIAKGLREKGVSVVREALNLGDVAWVARSVYDNAVCVLDVIVERKRLDDLVSSIIDKTSRFHDQKFRLHQSGMSRVIYLVEEYQTRSNKEQWGPQISTALSSTQVVDGFLVKETKNLDDTIAYLATWTTELRRSHATKDLFMIPTHMLARHSYLNLQKYLRTNSKHAGKCYVTSFPDFQTLNHKSVHTTVRETYARMLLAVRGLSAEKVGAVIERWDTFRALMEAFEAAQFEEQEGLAEEAAAEEEARAAAAAGTSKGKGKGKAKKKSEVKEARLMLHGVGGAEGGARAIGQALSTKIYRILMSGNYDLEEADEEE
ncbi:ERCC4 domain-containing protein [Favolaschia claudopus]|uniref:Crossover junction endonuclease MUS81 n=1 Tax=Favolaschia claudopus TaxID=2862362 RepID=A0AAW0E758_9AGAR